jgi:hypothetical protein
MLWWRFGYSAKNSWRRSEEFSSLQKAAWVAEKPVSATFPLFGRRVDLTGSLAYSLVNSASGRQTKLKQTIEYLRSDEKSGIKTESIAPGGVFCFVSDNSSRESWLLSVRCYA